MMEDFHSSDVEFELPQKKPFQNAGKNSIVAMMDHAFEDRIETKRQVKQLTLVKKTPGSQYQYTLWWNRFTEFRKHTLQQDVDIAPKGETLERFLAAIVGHVKPRTNQVPSSAWIHQGVTKIVGGCIFHYPTFTLSPTERSRIASLLDSLFQQGRITTDPAWERNWVGAVVVRKLVASIVRNALHQGTKAWDVTLAKCLSIVMVAALGARAGDITKTQLANQKLPYLTYGDIVLKLKGGLTIDDLQAVITIRNEKGRKYDPHNNRIVLLKAVKSPDDSVVCPVKLLLVLALRLGNVPESSIDDLIAHTGQRKSKTVLWSFPERPVHCAFGMGGASLMSDTPALSQQLTKIMADAALISGVLHRLRSHDLRRGACRDAVNLPSGSNCLPSMQASAVIGHSFNGTHRDVTARYVGALDEDNWTGRLENNFVEPIYELEEADNPYQKRFTRWRQDEITEMCGVEGLDPDDAQHRRKASRLLEKRRRDEWADQERQRGQATQGHSPQSALLPTGGILASPDVLEDEVTNDPSALDAVPEDDDLMDPQLLQQSQQLYNVITNNDVQPDDPQIEGLVFDTVQGLAPLAGEAVTSDSASFVRFFSTINVSSNQTLPLTAKNKVAKKAAAISRIEGNSRDKVTSFVYACKNQLYGCTHESTSRDLLNRHEERCKITSREVFEALESEKAQKQFECTVEDCASRFAKDSQLRAHITLVHGPSKRVCPKGCDPQKYYTPLEMRDHMDTHTPWTPTTCRVPGCLATTTFAYRRTYRHHLTKVHKLAPKESKQYWPYEVKKWQPRKCGIEGCNTKENFASPGRQKKHLQDKHPLLSDDEMSKLIYGE